MIMEPPFSNTLTKCVLILPKLKDQVLVFIKKNATKPTVNLTRIQFGREQERPTMLVKINGLCSIVGYAVKNGFNFSVLGLWFRDIQEHQVRGYGVRFAHNVAQALT